MKRICGLLLAACLVLGLCACGQKAETSAPEGPTWQEQYDLGIKYLSEGNYEEAIIAFNAAIEIDPKRPEAYIGLADVYTALGDTGKAMEILNQALDTIGENDALRAALEALSASGSPETAPEIPEAILNYERIPFNWNPVYYEEIRYLPLTGSAAAALQPLISAGSSGDPDTALAALRSVTLEQFQVGFGDLLDSYGGPALNESDDGAPLLEFWSVWNGDLINCTIYFQSGELESIELDYRTAAGVGFYADLSISNNVCQIFTYVHSNAMSGWLYNGAFTGVHWTWENGVLDFDERFEGSAKDELLHGAYTDRLVVFIAPRNECYVFEAGHMTDAWTSPVTGERCYMMVEYLSPDGNVLETDYWHMDQDKISETFYVLYRP